MYEDTDELQHALLAWQIAARIEDDRHTRQAIKKLKQTITIEAESHFKSGLAYYQAGEFAKARNAFINTIRVLPEHKGARYYLKTRLHTTEQATYKVHRNDSYSKIASQIYGDPSKAQLIAYYNDNDPVKPLLVGTTLLLPVLDPRSLHPRPDINRWMKQAQKELRQKRYDKALSFISKIKKEISSHPKVLQISDEVHFAKGKALLKNQQYLAALKHLKQVRPFYKGRDKAIALARRHLRKQAFDEKLQLAEKHLSQKEYESAINVTEEILSQYPDNKRASALINEASYELAKQLLNRGEPASAAVLLQKTDPSYKDAGQLLSLARARVKSEAEKHYRKGVNHFINEDLEKAIREWRLALELNPKHSKARQDIKNAMQLLEKYQTLEKKP